MFLMMFFSKYYFQFIVFIDLLIISCSFIIQLEVHAVSWMLQYTWFYAHLWGGKSGQVLSRTLM